jgi:PII-like signaling protein
VRQELEHNGVLLRIYVSRSHGARGTSLFGAILEAMLREGLTGASVFYGAEGFGSHRRLSSDTVVEGLCDLPVLIEVAEEERRIRDFHPALEAIVDDGLVTVERIFIKHYELAATTE